MIQVPFRRSDNSAVLCQLVERAIVEHGVSVHGASPADLARAFAFLAAWPGDAAPRRERGALHGRERALRARIVTVAWKLGIELIAEDGEPAPAILQRVLSDMQVAEEVGGPEGERYLWLMEAISAEASARAVAFVAGSPDGQDFEGDSRVFEIARVCRFAWAAGTNEMIAERIAWYYDVPEPRRPAFQGAIVQHLRAWEALKG